MSKSTDDGSMASFVVSGLSAILKNSAKKFKPLRQHCETIIHTIQSNESKDDEEGKTVQVDTDADKYFLPFKMATETGQPKLMATALDFIQKLMAYGYLDGASSADSEVYPMKARSNTKGEINEAAHSSPPQTSSTSSTPTTPSSPSAAADEDTDRSKRRLITVIIDTFYECSMYKDPDVQLQVIKAILTAVTSVSCQVHDHSLLQAVTSCYQIYLQAANDINRATAKATLVQIFNLVFQRMEHFATQLKQLEAATTQSMANGSSTPSTSSQPSSPPSGSSSPTDDYNGSLVPPAPPSAFYPPPNSNGVKPGKRGYCVVCAKPANHYCLQTKDSVCGMECKLVNLQRKDPRREIAASVKSKVAAKFSVLLNDAYFLLRALVKLSYKQLPHPPESAAVDSKVLSLQLLQSVVSNAGHTFRTSAQFVNLVKGDLVNCLLRNAAATASSIESIFSLSSSIFSSIVTHFKPHLLKVIGPMVESIYLPYIANPNASYDHKYTSLQVVKLLCSDYRTCMELFINYDCDLHYGNIYQKMIVILEKVGRGELNDALLTTMEENKLKLMAIETLVEIAKGIHWWTQIGMHKINVTIGPPNGHHKERDVKEAEISTRKRSNSSSADSQTSMDRERESSLSTSSTTSREDSISSSSPPSSTSSSSFPPPLTLPSCREFLLSQISTFEVVDDPTLPVVPFPSTSHPSTSVSPLFHTVRLQKLKVEIGVMKFNQKPKKGIEYLVEQKMIEMTPPSIAAFLHSTSGLDKTQIGDYLGEGEEWNKKVLYVYIDQLNFHSMVFDDAIRHFVSGFRLPGEAQKIERMMEKFAEQYHKHNPNVFKAADTAFVLAYAVIMLNTDAHNPQVKTRMTREQFFANCRGIDNGADLPHAMLNEIYDRITTNEIKMKDDGLTSLLDSSSSNPSSASKMKEMNPKKRLATFMKESQQMVRRTQDIIKTKVGSKKTEKRAFDEVGGDEMAEGADKEDGADGEGDKSKEKEKERENSKEKDRSFYSASSVDWECVGPMFDVYWNAALQTFSAVVEATNPFLPANKEAASSSPSAPFDPSDRLYSLCLEGYRYPTLISSDLILEQSQSFYLSGLKKISLMGTPKDFHRRNVLATKLMLSMATAIGDQLGDRWAEVFSLVSEIDRLKLVERSMEIAKEGAALSNSPSSPSKQREVDSEEIETLDSGAIDRIFTSSSSLQSDSIVSYFAALRYVSEIELSTLPSPRLYLLTKCIDVTLFNMSRPRNIFIHLWAIIAEFCVKAGTHPSTAVSLHAIDALRQMGTKFLENREILSFQFQRQIFKPFESIMMSNQFIESRDLIIQCLSSFVFSKADDIKSGWKSIFVVLSLASHQTNGNLVVPAADLVVAIMEKHFGLIKENYDAIDECVNCLVAFGCCASTDISLQAIAYLANCATFLAENKISAPEGEDVTKRGSIIHRGSTIMTSLQSSESREEKAAPSPRPSSWGLKVWFLLLTGLSRMVVDPRVATRTRALETLFSILNEHGGIFTEETWRNIFHGVLFPIFDDVRHSNEDRERERSKQPPMVGPFPQSPLKTAPATLAAGPRAPAQPDKMSATPTRPPPNPTALAAPQPPVPIPAVGPPPPSDWLNTTCFAALNHLTSLFDRFFTVVQPLLPSLLHLLSSCILQDSEDIARIGVRCLQQFILKSGDKLSVSHWWCVLDALQDDVNKCIPHILISTKVRTILGLGSQTSLVQTGRKGDGESETGTSQGTAAAPSTPQSLDVPQVSQFPSTSTTPTTLSGPIALPFSPSVVYTKTKIQLLLLECVGEITQKYFVFPNKDSAFASTSSESDLSSGRLSDSRVLRHLTIEQMTSVIHLLEISIAFTRQFNFDIQLRRKLYAAGFVLEVANRLPQLFALEAKAQRIQFALLFRLYRENEKFVRGQRSQLGVVPSVRRWIDDDAAGKPFASDEDRPEFLIIPTLSSSTHSCSYLTHVYSMECALFSRLAKFLSDYIGKTQAGQLVSLEFHDDVLCAQIAELTSLDDACLTYHLDDLYPSVVDLIEWASPNVRSQVRKFFQQRVGVMAMQMAAIKRKEMGVDEAKRRP